MFFNQMRSRPKAQTTTLSSQTATGLRDIKSLFSPKKETEAEWERRRRRSRRTLRVASLQGYEVLLGVQTDVS